MGEQLEETITKVAENLIFYGFFELSHLLSNAKFDYVDNVYKIFIDKKYNMK